MTLTQKLGLAAAILAVLGVVVAVTSLICWYCLKRKAKVLTPEDKRSLRKGQTVMTDMLKVFDRVCRQHGLPYWAMGGTLIGAVRHKGWIPHDADVDVGMLEKDYRKLQKIFARQPELLSEHRFFFQDRSTDYKYKTNIGKIRYLDAHYSDCTSTKWHNGIQLDIFVFHEKGDLLDCRVRIPERQYRKNFIFPLRELPFEGFPVYVPHQYEEYCRRFWGAFPPPELPEHKRYPHEGRITFGVPTWMRQKYPSLYTNSSPLNYI